MKLNSYQKEEKKRYSKSIMLDPVQEENEEYLRKLLVIMITAIILLFVILEISLFMSYTLENVILLIGCVVALMGIIFWQMGKINFRFK